MKHTLIALLTITIALAVSVTYLKLFRQPPLTPLSILFLSLLGGLSVLLSLTLLLHDRRRGATLAKIWLLVITVSVTYVIVELVSSALLVERLSPPMIRDRHLHHKLVPNTRSEFGRREYRYVQTVNNVGLRGHDIELKRAQDRYRILMLGDSFTMGKGVANFHLHAILSSAVPSCRLKPAALALSCPRRCDRGHTPRGRRTR